MSNKTKGFLILAAVLLIAIITMGDHTCSFNLKDSFTGKFVPDPNITVVPELTQVAAPGTGGSGPMIYAITIPRFVTVTAKTYGYREKSVTVFMFPGRSFDILLDKKSIIKFFDKYGVEVMKASLEQLKAKGLFDEENMSLEGILLSIKNVRKSSNEAVIEGTKYRSGLGAIGAVSVLVYEKDHWVVESSQITWIS